jgi:hypothetical protein
MRIGAVGVLALALAGCHREEDAGVTQNVALVDSAPVPFLCRGGAPSPNHFTFPATVVVPPRGSASVSISTPPGSMPLPPPGSLALHCQVDDEWCDGETCAKTMVNFQDGLTWKRSDDQNNAVVTATAHNETTEPHTLKLVLDMPATWHP